MNNEPNYQDNLFFDNRIPEETKKLRELLKECIPYVNHRFIETRETLTKPYMASDKVLHNKAEKLLTKIDEALNEETS